MTASKHQTCMKYTNAECTVENSWWWAKEMPETCRVFYDRINLDNWCVWLVLLKNKICYDARSHEPKVSRWLQSITRNNLYRCNNSNSLPRRTILTRQGFFKWKPACDGINIVSISAQVQHCSDGWVNMSSYTGKWFPHSSFQQYWFSLKRKYEW